MTLSDVSSQTQTDITSRTHILRVFWGIVGGTMIVTALLGLWPEILGFAVKVNSFSLQTIVSSPVHLTDDVMISMRAGHILNETGRPAFNHADLAQPSTSYVTPYIFALLARILPDNASIAAFAFLGLFSVGLTFGFIYLFARSKTNAAILITALLLTATNLYYALNGWDHLFQAMCLTLAAGLALQDETSQRNLVIGGIALAFGILFRPDGALIALAILWAFFCLGKNHKQVFISCFLPFAVVLGSALAINYGQFGYLTPTTARLKMGASSDLIFATKQFILSGVTSYTSISLILVLSLFYLAFFNKLGNRKNFPIMLACWATSLIALYNNDFFPFGRMCWTSACVISIVIATSAPRIFNFTRQGKQGPVTIAAPYEQHIFNSSTLGKKYSLSRLVVPAIAVAAVLVLSVNILQRLKTAVVKTDHVESSVIAQQYFIVDWMNKNLNPADGALGFYYLGVSYHAPQFEIADFLGKADEAIATSKAKSGYPGHNKWDYEITLNKWHLQAIIPPNNSDPSDPSMIEMAKKIQRETNDQYYPAALILNERVNQDFSYCYVKDPQKQLLDKWGFFLRRELVARHKDQLLCH